ncbi:MAG: HAMP domain-containing histidine kinase [Flavobacteriaceae bacterium]|nr:HAMP domain-containing histidine kinase [Flavobacteriaceae bacterium]
MITEFDINKLRIHINGLLRLQLKSYFKGGAVKGNNFSNFLEAVSNSYEDYEEQLRMSQMAYAINAQELYEFNMRCSEGKQNKKAIHSSLNNVFRMLQKAIPNKKTESFSDSMSVLQKVNNLEQIVQNVLQASMEQENRISGLQRQIDYLNGFAHMVSHELKAPLQNINTLLQWTLEGEAGRMTASGKENLEMAMNNAERINNLLIDILIYYSIGNHKGMYPMVNLERILDNLIEKQIPSHISIQKQADFPTITGCRYGMEIIFSNLISNAVRSIGEKNGKIEINHKDLPDHHHFSVSDNGIGIEERYQSRIFELFQKLDSGSEGSGMGLSIAKGIVMVLGGRIDVISKEGEGAIFSFTISKHLNNKSKI